MFNIVSYNRKQTKSYKQYQRGSCDEQFKNCSENDWKVSQGGCATGATGAIAYCSVLNPAVCLNSMEDRSDKTLKPVLYNVKWADRNSLDEHVVTCNYNIDQITSENQILALQNLWKDDPKFRSDYFRIMNNYCSAIQYRDCTTNPFTEKPMSTCTRLSKNGEYLCYKWFNNMSPEDRDNIIKNICLKNPMLEECKCYNRRDSPIYQAITTTQPISDVCWWKPCQTEFNNLIPSTLINIDCPPNICEKVHVGIEGRGVSIKDINKYTSCQISDSKLSSSLSPKTSSTKIKYIFYGSLITIFFSLIMIGFIIYTKKRN